MSDSKMPFNIEPFIPGTVPFSQFLEQLEWVFAHHKVTEDKDKMTSFMAACNREVYKEIKRLFPSKDLKQLTFKEITDALLKRYDKQVAGFIQRFQFYNRKQGLYESAEDFILDVKQHAELCDFGAFKDVAIRDRLICGMADSVLQENMFDEDDLSLARVEKLIMNREANNARKKLISGESRRASVLNRLGRRDGAAPDNRNRSRSRGRDLRGRSRSRSGRDWLDVFFPGWRNTFGDTCQVNQLATAADQVLADVEMCIPDCGLRGGGGGGREIWFTRLAIPEDRTGRNQFAIVEAVGVWCFTVRGRLRRISYGTASAQGRPISESKLYRFIRYATGHFRIPQDGSGWRFRRATAV
ncbi:uncharacterized protein LOC128093699 isoform X4 [Culex pipiens pallens]|uniref:uncharacterized protein LOC128093699 isoform X4 n=1 Tax=Culex pipiens pallens TaxID=42434 RepID=UPI0022AAA8B4|nr:uncharacterized protein LOC128093699 isoform X4 [Culex pipiens pallens]